MERKVYKLRYLPLFAQDLSGIIDHITNTLGNKKAAEKLIDKVEQAILHRLPDAESFEPYHSKREREYPYYRIYVNNYTVFYVVIDDVMEVRRILYNRRNVDLYI